MTTFHYIVKAVISKKTTHPHRQPSTHAHCGPFTLRAAVSTHAHCEGIYAIHIGSHRTLSWRFPPSCGGVHFNSCFSLLFFLFLPFLSSSFFHVVFFFFPSSFFLFSFCFLRTPPHIQIGSLLRSRSLRRLHSIWRLAHPWRSLFRSRYCGDFHSIWWAAISAHAIVATFHFIAKAAISKKAAHPHKQPSTHAHCGPFTLWAAVSTHAYCEGIYAIHKDSHRSRYRGAFHPLVEAPISTHANVAAFSLMDSSQRSFKV